MSNDPITSRDNRWLKRVRKAAEQHEDEIVLEGPKQIDDALARGLPPLVVLVREGRKAPTGCDLRVVQFVGERAFRTIGDTSTSQGLVALFERPRTEPGEILAASGPVLVLDGVQDPGNVGAVVRLTAAFDGAGVIALSGSADPFSPRAIRGSAGCVLTTPVATCSADTLDGECRRTGRPLFVAMPEGPSIERALPADAVVLLGSEGRGISQRFVDLASPFSIPTSSRVESLNVSTAAAIILWEISRSTRR